MTVSLDDALDVILAFEEMWASGARTLKDFGFSLRKCWITCQNCHKEQWQIHDGIPASLPCPECGGSQHYVVERSFPI